MEILRALQEEATVNSRFAEQYPYIKRLITGELFEVQEALKQKVQQNVEYHFNQAINCGGYALKVDTCVFPSDADFDTRVSGILDNFPFVRLLGDTELQEDEYLVLYRARRAGHHFIRIEEDGTVTEKNGSDEPQKFQDWETLRQAPEAVFAVKKEHDMNYFKKRGSIVIPEENSKNFEQTVWEAMQNRKNTFTYHNHNYRLKKATEETIYICSGEEIVAEMITNGEEYDLEIRPEKERYVSNTQPKRPIVIKDGKCQREETHIK
ncbi:MAG: hypothetical protein HFJ28_00925 [Clostridia bacterium]|nr:hypothetical protein [Clostridia bacterium]